MDIFEELMGSSSPSILVDTKDVLTCSTPLGDREYTLIVKLTPTTNYQDIFVGFCSEIKQFIVVNDVGILIKDKDVIAWAMEACRFLVNEELHRKVTPPLGVL